jgi:hypothetical protein
VVPAAWINLLKRLTAPDLDDRAVTFDEVCRLLMDVDVGQPDSRDLLRRSLLPPFPSRELQSISGSYSTPTPTPADSDSVFPNSPPPPENDTVIIDDVELD